MIYYTTYMGKTINFDQQQQMFCVDLGGTVRHGHTAAEVQRVIDSYVAPRWKSNIVSKFLEVR